jgi:uncharacterized protein YjbJ (UPF0337 family)
LTQPIIEQKWNEWKTDLRAHWGHVTDEDWRRIEADREGLLTVLQERYGYTREQAQQEVDSFVASRHDRVERLEAADETASEMASGATSDRDTNDLDNGVRAQRGDILGLDSEGETTNLGDTASDEDKRRVDALRRGAGH